MSPWPHWPLHMATEKPSGPLSVCLSYSVQVSLKPGPGTQTPSGVPFLLSRLLVITKVCPGMQDHIT